MNIVVENTNTVLNYATITIPTMIVWTKLKNKFPYDFYSPFAYT